MHTPFARWRMLYSNSYVQHAGLPTNHIIVQLTRAHTPEHERARALLRHIFQPRKKLHKRVSGSVSQFAQLICNYRKFSVGRCLARCCPYKWRVGEAKKPILTNNTQRTVLSWHAYDDGYDSQDEISAVHRSPRGTGSVSRPAIKRRNALDGASIEELLKMDSSHAEVTAYLREFCSRILPYEIWGSRFNEAIFHRKVARFVRLRRHEGMCINDIIAEMRTRDIPWLQNPQTQQPAKSKKRKFGRDEICLGGSGNGDHSLQKQLLGRFVAFVFEMIISLLKNSFYVTERESKSTAVAYFRKPVWSAIRCRAQDQCLPQFTPLLENDRKRALKHLDESSLGLSSVRLLPKAKSVRAITNLSKRLRSPSNNGSFLPSTNMTLTALYHVLKYECSQKPSTLGYTVHGFDDIWARLGSYVRTVGPTLPNQLFFASVDLKQCFDMISQKKLFDIVSGLLMHDTYILQKCTVVHPLPSSVRRFHVQHTRKVSPPGGFSSFWDRAHDVVDTHSRAVVLEGSTGTVVQRQQLIELLREHIFNNMVQISARGVRYFKQHMGIAQGSILSALLCNIYYGSLETTVIPSLRSQAACFRLMDDYIFIATNAEHVRDFLSSMDAAHERGEYTLNRDKTRSNLDADTNWFPWCGFEFNTRTLSVRPGVSKFNNITPFDLLTVVNPSDRPGETLISKMCSYMAPKSHPILFDSAFNSLTQVYENVLYLGLLGAVKSRAHILSLPRRSCAISNTSFVIKSVYSAAKYLCILLLRRFQYLQFHQYSIRRDFVVWLGLRSFVAAFEQKPHIFLASVLSSLQAELNLPRYNDARRALSSLSIQGISKFLEQIMV